MVFSPKESKKLIKIKAQINKEEIIKIDFSILTFLDKIKYKKIKMDKSMLASGISGPAIKVNGIENNKKDIIIIGNVIFVFCAILVLGFFLN